VAAYGILCCPSGAAAWDVIFHAAGAAFRCYLSLTVYDATYDTVRVSQRTMISKTNVVIRWLRIGRQ